MRIPSFQRTRMLTPTAGERLTGHPAVVLLCSLLVLQISRYGGSLLASAGRSLLSQSLNRSVLLLLALFATVVTVICVLLYCLIAERRSLLSLGFSKKGALAEYAGGLMGGIALFGLSVLLCMLTGTLTLSPTAVRPSPVMLLLFFIAFVIQGMSEELFCRSFLMISLSRSLPLWVCVTVNALLFSLLHLGNPGISLLSLVNILLFGLFASMVTLRRGSIWLVGGLHSMWNFAQGNLFGVPVSGNGGFPSPLTSTLTDGGWQSLVNGGDFGLEGGLAVTAVLAAACMAALFMPTKKGEIATDP